MPDLHVPPKFKRVAKKKELRLQAAIARCLQLLGDDPRHPGLHTHRVQGAPGVWEAYIDAANRVTFHWDNEVIVLRNNCNHAIVQQSP